MMSMMAQSKLGHFSDKPIFKVSYNLQLKTSQRTNQNSVIYF